MNNYNDTDLQKLSVKNNTAKQRVKRDLKELSLYEIFKQYTVKIVKELTYEKFRIWSITKEDLGIEDDTSVKFDIIAQKLKKHKHLDIRHFPISYDVISGTIYSRIIYDFKLKTEPSVPVSAISRPLFEKYFNTIKTFYSQAGDQSFLDDITKNIIDPKNELSLDQNFYIIFLPWLENMILLDDGKNGVKIAEVAIHQKVLDKYDSWKDIFIFRLEQLKNLSGQTPSHMSADSELLRIKFNLACSVNDFQEVSAYIDTLSNNRKRIILEQWHVWELIFKHNVDPQKRVEFIQSIFKLTRDFEPQIISSIGFYAFKHAAAQNNDQAMTAVLNCIENSDIKVTVLCFTLTYALTQNDKITDVVLKKAVELGLESKVLSDDLIQALHENDRLITAVLNKAAELNVAAHKVLSDSLIQALYKHNDPLVTTILNKARVLNVEKKVLDAAFSTALNENDTETMIRVLNIAIESNRAIDLSEIVKSGKVVEVLVGAFFQADRLGRYRIMRTISEIKGETDLVKKVLHAGFIYFQDGDYKFELLEHLWSSTDTLPYYKEGRLQFLKDDGFKAFRLFAQNGNEKMVEFLYSKAEKFEIQNEMLEFNFFGAFRLAVSNGHESVVEFFINKRPDIVNVVDYYGTALHRAVSFNRIGIVEILLNNEADIDYVNNNGDTALHIAVEQDHEDIVQFLKQDGARIDVQNRDGETPLDLAKNKLNNAETKKERQKYQRIINRLSYQSIFSILTACLSKHRNKRETTAGGSKCLLEDEEGKVDKETGIEVNGENLSESEIDNKQLKMYQDGLNNKLADAVARGDENAQNLIKEEQGQLNKLIIEIQQAQAIENFNMLSEEFLSQEFNDKLLDVIERTNGAAISPESLQHFEQVIKINLLRIVSPLIRNEKFKDLLLSNPGKFGQDLLDSIFIGIEGAIFNEYKERLSYEDFENIESKINEEISHIKAEIKDFADQDVNKSHLLDYALVSMELSELLADTDASADLRNRMSYEALVTLGALIHDHETHIKANHHKHKHNPQMNALNNRIGKSQLLAIAHDLHKLHKGSVNQDELKSQAIKTKIASYGNVDSNYIINDLFNRFSSKEIKNIFKEENIKSFGAELKAYKKEVITIHSNQISKADGKTIIKVQHGLKSVELSVGSNQNINDINNYVLDEQNLQIKLKIDGKEYIITPELEGEEVKYFLNIEGYKVKIGSIINNVGQSVERGIHHKLNQLRSRIELLEDKRNIENIADTKLSHEDYDDTINEIKQGLLARGIREETWKQFNEHLESLNDKIYTEYVNAVERGLTENNVGFDRSKFELAKIKGAKGGKFMSFLAIYDLFDSTADLKGLGDSPLNTIFGINGLLDAMDDVRESLSTQYARPDGKIKTRLSRSGLGKITNKIPAAVRKDFVRMINNPVVQSVTFVTIAWQFGHSIDQIVKGENVALNSYFATSSGIKLTSMGTSFGIRGAMSFGAKTTSIALRSAMLAAKVLGKLSIVTAGVDVVVSAGIDLHQGLEYTKMIASHIPLSSYQKFSLTVEKGGIAGILCYLNLPCLIAYLSEKTKSGEEYERDIKIKQYFDLIKKDSITLLNQDHNIAAVVQHVVSIKESYSKIIKVNRMQAAGKTNICGTNENYYDIDFLVGSNAQNDLSLLNTNEFLNVVEHNLDPLETIESIEKCHRHFYPTSTAVRKRRGIKVTNCHDIVRKVYTPNISLKHFPYLDYTEYNRDKIRFLKAPFSIIDTVEKCDKQIFPLQKIGKFSSKSGICNVDKIHRNCTRTFTITGDNIEPFILTKIDNNPKGKIVYLPGPKTLTAAADYPATIYVTRDAKDYTGSANHETTFIVNDNTGFCDLKGGLAMAKKNIISLNINAHNINVNLNTGQIIVNAYENVSSSIIILQNIYNYISNTTAQQSITTDCKTRYVNAGGGSRGNTVKQGRANCKDEDHEVRVVHKNDVHYRGSKQAIFVVNRNSNNATIIVDNINKNSTNIIRLEGLDIERLRIKEAEDYYNLTLLANGRQTTSVKVIDDLKNLVIYTEKSQTIFVQDKSLPDFIRDMQYQKFNHSGEYVDDRILTNSEIKSKVVILQEINDAKSTNWVARDIANKGNNIGFPAQIMVTKHRKKELIEQAVIHDMYSKNIHVDLSKSGDFNFGYPFNYMESIKTKDENTTIFDFLDGYRVHLNHNGHNIDGYVFNETRSISEVIADGDYQDITNELNTTIPIKFDDEILLIGTKEDDVLRNNPNYKTHLIGNGGKDRYVIGMNLNDFSIPNVIIYDPNGPAVDLHDLKKKLKGKFGSDLNLERSWKHNYDVFFDSLINDKIFSRIHIKQCKLKNVNNLVPFSKNMRNISIVCGFNQELLRITRKNISSILDDDNSDPLRNLRNLFNNNHADLSVQDDNGNTALHFACKNCNYDVVKYLIEEKNARINVKNKDGQTPLDLANECQQSQKEQIVGLFRKAQSELDKQLLSAVIDGDLAKVRSLVSRGANLDTRDSSGITPLHYAAWQGHPDVFNYFVGNGVDVNAKDDYGNSPLDLVGIIRYRERTEFLERAQQNRSNIQHRPRRSIETKNDEVGKEENFKMEREEVQAAASSATKPSSWISDSFGLIKSFIGGLIGLSSSVKEISNATPQSEFKKDVPNSTTPFDSTGTKQESDYTGWNWNFLQNLFQGFVQDNVNYVDENLKQAHKRQMPTKFESKNDTILEMGNHYTSQVDGNGTLQLLDMFIRKIRGTKPLSFKSNDISELVAQGYALDIGKEFEKAINQSANKSGISVKQLQYNPVKIYDEVKEKIIDNKLKEIPEVLKLHAAKALPQKLGNSHLSKFKIEFDKEINARLEPLMQRFMCNATIPNPDKQSVNQKRFKQKLPKDFQIGQSVTDGNCFFDSFRQGLQQQRGITVTSEQLRKICQEFVQQGNLPKWFKDNITNSCDNSGNKRHETVTQYIKNIMDCNRWGNPEVEGRILCQKYNVKLHIAETQNMATGGYIHQIISAAAGPKSVDNVSYRRNMIHMINKGNNHFEPILRRQNREEVQLPNVIHKNKSQDESAYLPRHTIQDNLNLTNISEPTSNLNNTSVMSGQVRSFL